MKYYLIAGEASGDLHGSLLMKGLAAADSSAQFRFWGGGAMAAVGGEKVHDYRDTAVMGIVEVIAKAGRVRRNLAACKKDIVAWRPDVVILIDYPGFNLKIARFAHKKGFKVFYYIAPKVWASREGRVKQLRRYVDKLFVIFPFEVEWFRSRGIEPVYEGNPLVDHIDSVLADTPVVPGARPSIALLPGSRLQEIKWLAPRYLELARLLETGPLKDYRLVLAAAPGVERKVYEDFFGGSRIEVVYGNTYGVIRDATAAVVASGTASLETAIIGTPQVVCYGMNPITFKIAISIMKVKYISLANIILDRLIFKELLQEKCTSQAIASELERLVFDGVYRSGMLEEYDKLRVALGAPGAAGRIAAGMSVAANPLIHNA